MILKEKADFWLNVKYSNPGVCNDSLEVGMQVWVNTVADLSSSFA